MPSSELTVSRRIGIFGGTFSPPHNGHVRAAVAFLEAARLDVLHVIPAARLPGKALTAEVDPALRLAMTRAAFADVDPRIQVSDYEIKSGGISYTYRTLAHFREVCGGELILLCGTDTFLSLDTWLYPERIFDLSAVACVMRKNDPALYASVMEKADEYRRRFGAQILEIPVEPLKLSSTLVRQMIREGREFAKLVPPGVYNIIEMHNLYRSDWA